MSSLFKNVIPGWLKALVGARSVPDLLTRLFDTYLPQLVWQALYYLVPVNLVYRGLQTLYSRLLWSAEGHVVLIADASSSLGKHLAYEYAKQGARLMLAAPKEDQVRVVADQCLAKGAQAVEICAAEIGKEEDCRQLMDTTVEKHSRLDVLVMTAGRGRAFLFKHAESVDTLRSAWDETFMGTVWLTSFALPHLRSSHGRILVNASLTTLAPLPGYTMYSATKSALVQFLDTVRVEEAGHQVGITIAFSGLIASELPAGTLTDEQSRPGGDSEAAGDKLLGAFPVASPAAYAEAMVKAVAWGRRYVVIPRWGYVLFLYRLLAVECLESVAWWKPSPWRPPPKRGDPDARRAQPAVPLFSIGTGYKGAK